MNHYPEALADELGLTPAQARWRERVRSSGAMQRVTVAEVTERLDALLAPTGGRDHGG